MDVYSNTFITDQLEFMAATATDREVARCGLTRGDVIITKDSEKHDDIGVPALIRHDVANLVCGYHLAILLRPRAAHVVGGYNPHHGDTIMRRRILAFALATGLLTLAPAPPVPAQSVEIEICKCGLLISQLVEMEIIHPDDANDAWWECIELMCTQ